MADETDARIVSEEQDAMKAVADENLQELRKEEEENNDEVVIPTYKPERSLAAPTLHSNDNVKKEAPEMNIQLQR